MGKVRRLRKKYHLACQKSETATSVVPVVQSLPGRAEVPVKLNSDSNIFAGLTISLTDLKQTLLPPSTQVLGSVSEASTAEIKSDKTGPSTKHVPKKEKRFARREALLRRIDTVRKLKQESKKAMKPAKKRPPPKPMAMQSLFEALPLITTDKEQGNSKQSMRTGGLRSRPKAFNLQKKRMQHYMDDMKAFKTILHNAHYKADPVTAISNYLQRTVAGDA